MRQIATTRLVQGAPRAQPVLLRSQPAGVEEKTTAP